MSMQDFASALGGGGGAPPDLGGGGAPPDAGAPPDDTGGGQETYQNSLEALQVAEDALHAFIKMDPDHGDRAVAAQCLQNVLKLQASNQDSARSGDLSSLQRALQGGPAGVGGAGGAGAGPPGA